LSILAALLMRNLRPGEVTCLATLELGLSCLDYHNSYLPTTINSRR